ncbi:MAG: thioredoxin family protein [Chitinispirillaceae bacterium]|nr:thioredoxin family protein [Chitinispirillaceae bacterium]
MTNSAKSKILSAVALSFLIVSLPAAQPFSRYFDEPPATDSSQQIADRIVKSELPVVVDFWAAWCAPCKMLEPVIAKLEKSYKGRVLFMKVNADYNRQLAAYLGVQGIPAVFFIRDKAVKQVLMGVRPEADYRRAIKDILAMPAAAKLKQDTGKAQSAAKKPDTDTVIKKNPKPSKTENRGVK